MTGTVRAAVQLGPRRIEVREFPRPVVGPDEGLVRIEANGVCGSDVEQYKGALGNREYPTIPGHEPIGVVEEIGERAAERLGVQVGDRVVVEIIASCRSCRRCLAGKSQSCRNRYGTHGVSPVSHAPSLWGGLAEYLYLSPGSMVHRMRNDVPIDLAATFNPLAAGVRWCYRLGGTQLGDTVLVLGAGQRGLASVIAAKAVGAETVIVTGLATDAHKLALARELGADHTIVVDEEDTVERVTEITDGEMADVVLELTPMAAGPVTDALRAVRHGGRVVLAGLKGGREIPFVSDLVIQRAATVVGAYGVDSQGYEDAIRIIESGRHPLEKLHTHAFGLDDTALALETLAGEVPGEHAVAVSVQPWL